MVVDTIRAPHMRVNLPRSDILVRVLCFFNMTGQAINVDGGLMMGN
jgi:hypothetical protein